MRLRSKLFFSPIPLALLACGSESSNVPSAAEVHVSNGDDDRNGILGARVPTPFRKGWRAFYTDQHGDNQTWEIIRSPGTDDGDDR